MALFAPDQLTAWQARLRASSPPPAAPPPARRPLHVVYGGAHRFKPDIAAKLGRIALDSLHTYAPDAPTFAAALGLPEADVSPIYARVREKLQTEPVEDYRIDFEDGYGVRADAEEDQDAIEVGRGLAEGLRRGGLPGRIGLRLKALEGATGARSLRTLGLVLEHLDGEPPELVITLPKIRSLAAVSVAAEVLLTAEKARGWPPGTLVIEAMVEDPGLWFDEDGRFALPRLPEAAGGRLVGVHLGPYDYAAAVGIAGADHELFHPALDVARHLLQVAFVGQPILLGDGPSMLMPTPPHRGAPESPLSAAQHEENQAVVHAAWRHHARAVRASLHRGFDMGWDLHPAQIPARLGVVYATYRAQLPDVARRLRNFIEAAGHATRVGAVFDDAATGQGLLNFCLRAIATGAVDERTIVDATGVTSTSLATRSFAAIVEGSRASST